MTQSKHFPWGDNIELARYAAETFRDAIDGDLRQVWCDVHLWTDPVNKLFTVSWV